MPLCSLNPTGLGSVLHGPPCRYLNSCFRHMNSGCQRSRWRSMKLGYGCHVTNTSTTARANGSFLWTSGAQASRRTTHIFSRRWGPSPFGALALGSWELHCSSAYSSEVTSDGCSQLTVAGVNFCSFAFLYEVPRLWSHNWYGCRKAVFVPWKLAADNCRAKVVSPQVEYVYFDLNKHKRCSTAVQLRVQDETASALWCNIVDPPATHH